MTLNIIIIGGSGVWSDQAYSPAILNLLQKKLDLSAKVIIDPKHPLQFPERTNNVTLFEQQQPQWLFEDNPIKLTKLLNQLHQTYQFNVAIICCDPIYRYDYLAWALQNNIAVIADKPLVLTPNCTSSSEAAQTLLTQYETIEDYCQNQWDKCFTPLGYRHYQPFVDMAKKIKQVYQQTDAAINYMTMINNFGLARLPQEFSRPSAHGYTAGVGSVSHTFYHHLDALLWLLQQAPGNLSYSRVSIPYVYRVADYLKQKKYQPIVNYLNLNNLLADTEYNSTILNTEYDFTVQFILYDQDMDCCGRLEIINCASGFNRRTMAYHDDISDPGHYLESGRMKQFTLDIQQAHMQHLRFIRDNELKQDSSASLTCNRHPLLVSSENTTQHYQSTNKNHYIELIEWMLMHWSANNLTETQRQTLSGIHNQAFSFRCFAKIIELLALENQARQQGDYLIPQALIDWPT